MFKCLNAAALGIRATLSEQVELALLGGFRGVDVSMVEVTAMVTDHGLDYTQSIFRSAKLLLGSWALPDGWRQDEVTFEKDLDRLPQLAEVSQQLGGSRAVTAVEPASDERPFHENFEWHRKRLGRVAESLTKHDCRLGLEFTGAKTAREGKAYEFIRTLDAAVQLAEAIGTGNVGVVLDSFHWYTSGGTLADVRKLRGKQVVALHVSDAPADVPLDQQQPGARALPGQTGVIDLVGLLKTLKDVGYEGPVVPEPFDRQLRMLPRERAVRATSEALTALWTEAGLP